VIICITVCNMYVHNVG